MIKTTYATLVFSLILIACWPTATTPTTINGTWSSIGAGWVLDIRDSATYSFYDYTSQYCAPFREDTLGELLPNLTLQGDTLALRKGVITYKFLPIASVPKVCEQSVPPNRRQDPLFNFEVFAEIMSDHYAFFDLNGIEWSSLYTAQKAKLAAEPTAVRLYQIIEETLDTLHDNHGYLEADDTLYAALEAIPTLEIPHDSTGEEQRLELGDIPVASMVSKHHLIENNTEDSWLIDWGLLTEDIGFLQIKTMWLYADLDIPDSLIQKLGYVNAYVETFQQMNEGAYINLEVSGVRKIMARAMKDLKDKKAIVIDLRFNGGGQDAVSFEILRWFNPERRQIATERLRIKDTFSPDLPLYLEGSADAYTQPVYLLTSQQTGSAAEAFTLASLTLPNFRRIGQHTAGAMSTALEKRLPNGWFLALSNEIYEDMEGNVYENIGIPVDVAIPYPADRQKFFYSVAEDLAGDKAQLMTAIERLQNQQ